MVATTFDNIRSSFLQYELEPNFTRDTVVIAAGANLKAGTILGKVTSGGKYKRVDLTAQTGEASPVAILLNNADAASVDVTAAVLVRGPAILIQDGLTYNANATSGNKATINAALLVLGLRVEVAAV
jgi:hypothetical protein